MVDMASRKFYQYDRFLESKAEVDASAMSPRIWKTLTDIVGARSQAGRHWPRRILDCGCGTGMMLRHLKSADIQCETYIGIDIRSELLQVAQNDVAPRYRKVATGEQHWIPRSVYTLGLNESDRRLQEPFELVCAMSLAEHVEIDAMLAAIWRVMPIGGLLLLPINYDGDTIFEPVGDRECERRIIDNFNNLAIAGQVYEGRVGGNPFCGRQLPHALERNGFKVLVCESEDWVLSNMRQPLSEDKRKFLGAIVDAVAEANLLPLAMRQSVLRGSQTDSSQRVLDSERDVVNAWRAARHQQIDDGTIFYVCHQMGALAEKVEVPLRVEAVRT